MTTDIYIKTYKKDFPFLKYCLKSIHKFCTGFNEIIIVVDENDYDELLTWNLTKEKIFAVNKQGDGYMWQQVCKLNAHEFSLADNILFVDSDVVIHKPCSPETFMMNSKPILLKTPYERLDGQAKCWQEITAKAIGHKSEFEWMRRLPTMYKTKTLINIVNSFPDLDDYIMKRPNHEFSEFNFIGQFIEINEQEDYSIINTDDFVPDPTCIQSWSWGGLTDELKNEFEKILNEN